MLGRVPKAARKAAAPWTFALLSQAACTEVRVVEDEGVDEATSYIESVDFRRQVLEEDLTGFESTYAQERLAQYGIEGVGWEAFEAVDRPSRPLGVEEVAVYAEGGKLDLRSSELTPLVPQRVPAQEDDEAWRELGERVFFNYVIRPDPMYKSLASVPDALENVGFVTQDGAYVGLRVVQDDFLPGRAQVGITCAMCHASVHPETGEVSGVLANREMDVGAAQLLGMGLTPGDLPPEIDSTHVTDLDRLGPGRNDVLADGVFNPYAVPDFGGIVDMPFLHHTANWFNRSAATLAVRCETLFITSSGYQTRIPRVLSYALSRYLRSLPPPPRSLEPQPAALVERGQGLFEEASCIECHTPPLYTSSRWVTLEEVGTDPLAGQSPSRFSGAYRIPSLRGVAHTAPYFHHGAVDSLEDLFDPAREEPGHPFGQQLSADDRAALVAFLRTL